MNLSIVYSKRAKIKTLSGALRKDLSKQQFDTFFGNGSEEFVREATKG